MTAEDREAAAVVYIAAVGLSLQRCDLQPGDVFIYGPAKRLLNFAEYAYVAIDADTDEGVGGRAWPGESLGVAT